MPRGRPSPKLAITVDPEVYAQLLAAAAEEGVSVSAWMTDAARRALLVRDGLAAVAEWEAQHGAFTDSELAEVRRLADHALSIAPDLAEQIKSGLALTINGSRYLMVEWAIDQFPAYADHAIFDLRVHGIVPIIAHAERYRAVQRSVDSLATLVRRGALVQVTAGSLAGESGPGPRRAAERILLANLGHVLATDSHSIQRRPPILATAWARAAELIGTERASALVVDVPRQIIDNRPIDVPDPVEHESRPFWAFWRSGT